MVHHFSPLCCLLPSKKLPLNSHFRRKVRRASLQQQQPGSHCVGVWVLHVEYRELDSSGDDAILWGATLGSTVVTCSASVRDASGRNSHIFFFYVDSNPEVFLFRSHAEWRSVLSRCLRCLEIGNFMHELHMVCRCMMKGGRRSSSHK